MYSQIDSNRRKSVLLILVFVAFLAAIGWLYGYLLTDTGPSGIIIALIISIVMAMVSWFAGDKIALSTVGAVEVTSRDQAPLLWNTVENLAITAGIPKPRIYVVDDDSPNAFATGRDPQHSSIAVTTGLLRRMEKIELEGVLAHEMSHVKNYDSRLLMLVVVLVGALSILSNRFFRFGMFRGRRDRNNDLGLIMLIGGLVLIILSPIIGQLIKMAVSRKREYLADASGALLTRYPEGLARALEKIRDANVPMQRVSSATNHLWIAEPTVGSSFNEKIANAFSTHPPINDRIAKLREMADNR